MSSLKSKIIIGLVKNRHLFRFKLRPEIVDENFNVHEFRERTDKMSLKTQRIPEDIEIKPIKIDRMYSEWIINKNSPENKVILYIHGGGFMSGSCDSHRGHVSKFVMETQIKALLFDYRLAPEFPFPAAVEDCLKAYEYLLEKGYSPQNIIICGESAGGTLTLSLLKLLRNRNYDLPKAAVSISPVTDLSCSGESFHTNAKNDIAPMNSWNIWTDLYIGKNDYKDEILSPIFGKLNNLPHIYLCIGTYEIHLSDTLNFAEKAIKHGTEITLKKWDKMVHAFPILSPLFPEAKRAFEDICLFIKKKLVN